MQHRSFQEYWTFLTSFPEGVFGIILLVILLMGLINYFGQEFWCWLKGSRVSHYLTTTPGYEEVYTTHPRFKLRTENQSNVILQDKDGFNHRNQSRIFTATKCCLRQGSENWKIAGDCAWPNTLQWVYLKDQQGLHIKNALLLINTYPSLKAMLDRIAELEKKLVDSEKQLKNKSAGIKAVLRLIKQDKNWYRSKTSSWIGQWLFNLDHSNLNEVLPSDEEIKDWEGRFRIMTR